MFSDNWLAIIYDFRGSKRDAAMGGGWSRHLQVMQSYCPWCLDLIGAIGISLVRYEDESSYVLRLGTLVEHAGTVRGLIGLEVNFLIGRTTDTT